MGKAEGRVAPADELQRVLTRTEPLGPPYTEELLRHPIEIFRALYDDANNVHRTAHSDVPHYLVGRKGAGKTAFLAGAPLLEGADVVSLKSEHLYGAVERLRRRYERDVGPAFVDDLAHVWEVLLFHAAMLGICRSSRMPMCNERQCVWSYLSSYRNPKDVAADVLLEEVSGRMSASLRESAPGTAFSDGMPNDRNRLGLVP